MVHTVIQTCNLAHLPLSAKWPVIYGRCSCLATNGPILVLLMHFQKYKIYMRGTLKGKRNANATPEHMANFAYITQSVEIISSSFSCLATYFFLVNFSTKRCKKNIKSNATKTISARHRGNCSPVYLAHPFVQLVFL